MTYLSFQESRVYPLLSTGYHDATVDRFVLTDGVNNPASIRVYNFSAKLTVSAMAAFIAFFESKAGGIPFYFYHFQEVSPGAAIGSNWAADGLATQGRHVCIFQSVEWSKSYDVGQRSATSVVLREIA